MTLNDFIETLKNNPSILFSETMAVIETHYRYHPTEFSNGLGDDKILNTAGTNEGSCKLFSFARLHQLNQQQTLHLFGEYYQGVLATPEGSDHSNIRNFINYGWDGITFQATALELR
ncbi:MAG: HopJ type III effector protein [Methylococcales bacterium]|nr:HopJ type III effector protein [Methylococcales bacterium]